MLRILLSTITLCLISISNAQQQQKQINVIEFGRQALMAHNAYRGIHGVPELQLNDELSRIALIRAQEMAKEGRLSVKKNKFMNETVGESVGTVGGFVTYNGISATELWYCVLPSFDSEGESNKEGASFTQMVWKNTRHVGFGIAVGSDGKFYFAAEYFPSGNIQGQYEKNVFQIGDSRSSSVGPMTTVQPPVIVNTSTVVASTTTETSTTEEQEGVTNEIEEQPESSTEAPFLPKQEQASTTTATRTATTTTTISEVIATTAAKEVREENVTVAIHEKTTGEEVVTPITTTVAIEEETTTSKPVAITPAITKVESKVVVTSVADDQGEERS